MIVKYTEQEEQQLKKLGRVADAKLDRLNQIIRESAKDSEEYKNAVKEATELDYELFKARAAIYNQAEQREFSKVSGSVKSIVQNAKEQTEAIIDDIYQAMFDMLNGMQDTLERVKNHLKAGDASKEGEGFLLDSAWTIERIRTHLHLHFDALKNHDAAIKEINDYIIAAVARKPFFDAISKYDATAPTKQRFDPPLPLTTDAFFPIYHGKPTRSLATMSSRMIRKDNINPITGTAKIEGKGVKFELSRFEELKGALGVNTHKLLMVGIKELTRLNNESNLKAQSMKYIVSIPLEGYCTSCGYNVTEKEKITPKEQAKEKRRAANALKDATRKIRNDLQILKSLTMSWEDPSIKFRGSNAFYDIGVIGSSVIQQGYIYMSFDPLFSEYLVKSTIMQYPIALLGVDARSPNAYSIGLKMAWHYSIYNNHKKGTHDRLKVITLLEETTLPTYEEVVKTRKSWEERLKEPLENALDHLTQINFLKDWRYCRPKGETLEDEDADFTDYETWADTLLQFEMTNAPNHDDILKKLEEEEQTTTKAGKKKAN